AHGSSYSLDSEVDGEQAHLSREYRNRTLARARVTAAPGARYEGLERAKVDRAASLFRWFQTSLSIWLVPFVALT
ncbi:MAG TPA: hypothetical protein VFV34_01580, partial [Blastocatellia bacterium]|nr:hypothetical protein [Blastocatellia bacterium]